MATVIADLEDVTVPTWVNSLEAFRRWSEQPNFPKRGSSWWLCGEVWIDMSREQVFSHILVKTEYSSVLRSLTRTERLGLFLGDGLLLSNFAAEICGNPDGTFISAATLAIRPRAPDRRLLGRIHRDPGIAGHGAGSRQRQFGNARISKILRKAYWEPDIPEYWIVDARKDPLQFVILSHNATGLRGCSQ